MFEEEALSAWRRKSAATLGPSACVNGSRGFSDPMVSKLG